MFIHVHSMNSLIGYRNINTAAKVSENDLFCKQFYAYVFVFAFKNRVLFLFAGCDRGESL